MKKLNDNITREWANELVHSVAITTYGNSSIADLSSVLETRTIFPTLATEGEIDALQHGRIPAEVIYSGEAGKKLSAIDHNKIHSYSVLVNDGLISMFQQLGSELIYADNKLRECLEKTNTWIDIGTGNGVVSNTIAFSMINQLSMIRMNSMVNMFKNKDFENLPHYVDKTRFIACDFSKASLSLAEGLAKDSFHDLEKLFDLEYHHETFQQLLANDATESPRVITMFNVLANFSYEELEKILIDVLASMKPGDVFIPSFFVAQNINQLMDPYNIPFGYLTKQLYYNKETKDWCVGAFADRYKVNSYDVGFNVDRKNDGRDYISVSLSVPQNTSLHIPTIEGQDIIINTNNQTFEVFKSYRMSKQFIKKLCESVGFCVDHYRLEDRLGVNIAPVLYIG